MFRAFAMPCIALLALCAVTPAQFAINDVFDRPNGTALGPDWMEISGDAVISSNRLQGNAFQGWSAHTGYSAPFAMTVVKADWSMNGFGGDRVSLIAGADPNTWSGIEVKIADNNGDGLAERIFFDPAVNAGAGIGGTSFIDLGTPLVAGQATMYFTNGGDTVNLDVFDPVTMTTQTVSASGILSLAFPITGTAVGVGYFGNGWIDDFQAYTGSPTTPSYTLTPLRVGSPASFLVTGATPNMPVILAFSTVGAGPLPTPLGNVDLSLPIAILSETQSADANGRFEIALPALPPSVFGVTIYNQALDVGGPTLSNSFSSTVM